MLNDTQITVGIPDYYRDDQLSEDIDKYLNDMIVKSSQLGVSISHYLLEFCE
jgi:hypothetical protein